nr:unnamed protein product [Digitaria exilis]
MSANSGTVGRNSGASGRDLSHEEHRLPLHRRHGGKQGGLPLSSRTTLAAWPCSTNVTNGGEQGISMPRAANFSHLTGLGTTRLSSTIVTSRGNAFRVGRTTETVVEDHVSPPVVVNTAQGQIQDVQEINMEDLSTYHTREDTCTSSHTVNEYDRTHIIERSTQTIIEGCVGPPIRSNNAHEQIQCVHEISMQEQATAFGMTENIEERVHSPIRSSNAHEIQHAQEITLQEQATAFGTIERISSVSSPFGYVSQHGSHIIADTAANDVEAAQSPNVDVINQKEHSFILSGKNEKPFTYICSMLADWGRQPVTKASIQGKIKGVFTSVKCFQFRQRTKYELYVYIDDGSSISEAIVHHDIVKKVLGLSPGELTAALAGVFEFTSTSEVIETVKGFQRFLAKFEGMMLIECNKDSSIPIIRDLDDGCSSSNAWLLLRRLKTFSSRRKLWNLDAMDTTP